MWIMRSTLEHWKFIELHRNNNKPFSAQSAVSCTWKVTTEDLSYSLDLLMLSQTAVVDKRSFKFFLITFISRRPAQFEQWSYYQIEKTFCPEPVLRIYNFQQVLSTPSWCHWPYCVFWTYCNVAFESVQTLHALDIQTGEKFKKKKALCWLSMCCQNSFSLS